MLKRKWQIFSYYPLLRRYTAGQDIMIASEYKL